MKELTNQKLWNTRWDNQSNLSVHKWKISERGFEKFLQYAFQSLPKSAKILELGCAPGKKAIQHSSIRNDLVIDGIDYSKIGIKKAQEIYDKFSINGKLFHQDIHIKLPEKYDAVCSYGLIEHFENPQDIICCHLNHLKPGGKVIVTVPNYAAKPVKWILKNFAIETLQTHNLEVMSEEAIKKLLIDSGFVDVETGSFGGSIFPNSSPNKSIYGQLYKQVSRVCNFSVSFADILMPGKIKFPWKNTVWGIGRKNI